MAPIDNKKNIIDYIAAGYKQLPKGTDSTSAIYLKTDQHGNIIKS